MFARARNRRHAWELMDLGVEVVRETFHSSLKMGERVLVALGEPRGRRRASAPSASASTTKRCCAPSTWSTTTRRR